VIHDCTPVIRVVLRWFTIVLQWFELYSGDSRLYSWLELYSGNSGMYSMINYCNPVIQCCTQMIHDRTRVIQGYTQMIHDFTPLPHDFTPAIHDCTAVSQSEAPLTTRTQQSPHRHQTRQSLPRGAPDSFRRWYIFCAVWRSVHVLLNGSATARLPPGCSVWKNFSLAHPRIFPNLWFSLHALIHVSQQSVRRLQAGYCFRPTNCSLWSRDDTHSTTGICSAVHSMVTRHDKCCQRKS
jgi:hypothetical protein